MDDRAATVSQLQMAGDEVGVEVGQEDMPDLKAELLSVGQVLLNVALRIDDDTSRTGLVSKQIRRVGQASQVVLFQNHAFSIGLARCAVPAERQPCWSSSRAKNEKPFVV